MARAKAKPIDEKPLEVDGVPTAAGLAARGRRYAYHTERGIHITDEGHALLGKILRDRGRADRENGVWHGISGRHPERPGQPGL